MSVTRVASRYAKSLLELAVEKGILEEINQDMLQLLAVVQSNRDFEIMLKSPVIKSDLKAKVIKKVFLNSVSELSLSFFDIMSKKNRENILPDVAREFQKQYNIHEDIQEAELITTFDINEQLRKVFVEAVKEISGRSKVKLIEKKDKNIIGGYVLKVNDRQLDESLSSKLRTLRLEFSHN